MHNFLIYPTDTLVKIQGALPGWDLVVTRPDSAVYGFVVHYQRAADASELFSSGSTLNPSLHDMSTSFAPISHITQSWYISVFIFLVLGYYIFVTYRYRRELDTTIRVSPSIAKTLKEYEQRNNVQHQLDFHAFVLLLLSITLTAMEFLTDLLSESPMVVTGLIMAAAAAIFLFKYFIVGLCQIVSNDRPRFLSLSHLSIHTVTIVALIYTPIAVAAATNTTQNEAILGILLLAWIYYIIRLFILFVNNGFGKLQWFLYLCAVEMLPVSFILALAARY